MQFLRRRFKNRKHAYGEPEDSSVNWFLLVVVLAVGTLLCFLVYALLSPLLFGNEPETKIVPYGWGETATAPPTAVPTVATDAATLPTAAPTVTPLANIRITPETVRGLQPAATLSGHSDPVSSVAYSSDGRLIASGDLSGAVRVWDAASGAVIASFRSESNRVVSVAVSPDGTEIAAGGQDAVVRRWSLATGTALPPLTGATAAINAVAYRPDGSQVAAASDDGQVYVWALPGGTLAGILPGHTSYVTSLAFTPDASVIAAGGEDDTIRLWAAQDGIALATLEGHSSTVSAVAFSPDGRTLASTGADHTVRLWNLLSASALRTLEGHTENVTSLAFSPDGRLLASGAGGIEDNTVRLWEVPSGALLHTLNPPGPVNAVAFSPDGTALAMGGATYLTLWRVATVPQPVIVSPPTVPATIPAQAIPDGQGGAAACSLTVRLSEANLREGPGTGYPVVGTLTQGQTIPATGWVTGDDGYTWWQLGVSGWVRGDAFVDALNPTLPDGCWTLPPVSGVPPTPGPAGSSFTPTPPVSIGGGSCTLIVRWDEANLRDGPGTTFNVIGTLALGQTVQAIGWARGAEGFTWWQLASGGWARGDVFVDAENPSVPPDCLTLPFAG